MNTQKIKLSELVPDPLNTRKHDKRNIATIKESLQKFGQYRPFVVQRQGMIIRVGNGMYQAMRELGWSEGYVEIKELSDADATALSILDNRSSELADWDDKILAEILKDMPDDMRDFVGFDESEINKLLRDNDLAAEVQDAEPRWHELTGKIPQVIK